VTSAGPMRNRCPSGIVRRKQLSPPGFHRLHFLVKTSRLMQAARSIFRPVEPRRLIDQTGLSATNSAPSVHLTGFDKSKACHAGNVSCFRA
jgi:hypothetical protein